MYSLYGARSAVFNLHVVPFLRFCRGEGYRDCTFIATLQSGSVDEVGVSISHHVVATDERRCVIVIGARKTGAKGFTAPSAGCAAFLHFFAHLDAVGNSVVGVGFAAERHGHNLVLAVITTAQPTGKRRAIGIEPQVAALSLHLEIAVRCIDHGKLKLFCAGAGIVVATVIEDGDVVTLAGRRSGELEGVVGLSILFHTLDLEECKNGGLFRAHRRGHLEQTVARIERHVLPTARVVEHIILGRTDFTHAFHTTCEVWGGRKGISREGLRRCRCTYEREEQRHEVSKLFHVVISR